MSRRVPIDSIERARALRNGATRHERKLWGMVSRLRPKFTRQLPIGPYFADFACRQAKLIVKLDGSQHAQSSRDLHRDSLLRAEGWTVLRIWNDELDENADGVFQAIVDRAAECLGGTHPLPFQPVWGTGWLRQSLPSREGRKRRWRLGQ